ncbi:MAG: 2-phosphosulfolactate phosphatase [Acidimicrobiia bacterium]|nr:2-phosphosulfolactate phosphatase [Acidimicrobiia bacterium]
MLRSPRKDQVDWFDQVGWRWRFGWGPHAVRRLAPVSDVVVVVDVLRFTTAVDVAMAAGALVFPYRWNDGTAADYATEQGAVLASKTLGPSDGSPWSLSPASLASIPAGTRLVLPSPNGSALCFGAAEAGATAVFAACLRNASAVAAAAARAAGTDGVVGVVAAGERWNGPTGPLRPALEDLLGAGAVLAAADDASSLSPEARSARAAFAAEADDLGATIASCGSGIELAERGGVDDLAWASAHDVSAVAPRLDSPNFVDAS